MGRPIGINGIRKKTSVHLRQLIAHQYDRPSGPTTDSFGRLSPTEKQMAGLAQTLETARKANNIMLEETDYQRLQREREDRRKAAKEKPHHDYRERDRGPVPGAFGRGSREREY